MKQELQNGWRKGKATAAPFGMVWIDTCRSRRCRLHLSWKPWAPASQCICAATLQTPLPCGASWSVQIRTFLPRVWFRKACSPVGLRCPFSMSQTISPMGSFLMCYLGSPKTTGFYWTFTRHTKEINKKKYNKNPVKTVVLSSVFWAASHLDEHSLGSKVIASK